ncbi:hypothetical protein AGMMS50230_20300 [Spirochaetia bacterium]|nr:hypothetical protein AGMMS50230_20300 [Spirochaetia bacterium]
MKKKVQFLRGAVFAAMLLVVLSCGGGAGGETTYTIGSRGPGGGIIFYVDDGTYGGGTWKYLEAAPAEIGGLFMWASADTSIPGTLTGIGTGAANTAVILAADAAAPAAIKCREYRGGGKSDWFLPSKDELNEMHKNKTLIRDFNLDGGFYRSSSEGTTNTTYAWVQIFSTGSQVENFKTGTNGQGRVRAIRAF